MQAVFGKTAIPDFQKTSEVLLFDAIAPLEKQLITQSLYKAMIWDMQTGQKLDEAGNFRYNDIAYTSFEHFYRLVRHGIRKWPGATLVLHSTGIVTQSATRISGKKTYKLNNALLQPGNYPEGIIKGSQVLKDKDYISASGPMAPIRSLSIV